MAKAKSGKLPYMPFYTADWIRDTRVLSLNARAIWADMLCMMHDGDDRGFMSRAGNPVTMEQLARYCGCSIEVATNAVNEIVSTGVASKNESGLVYSRRILRDEKRRQTNRRNGRRGGNPDLSNSVNRSDNPPVNPPDKGADNAPLASGIWNVDSEISGSQKGGSGGKPTCPPALRDRPDFDAAWAAWDKHRREIGHKLTPSTTAKQLAKMAEMGPDRAIAAIEHSIGNGWQGLYEPKPSGKPQGEKFSGIKTWLESSNGVQ